LGANAKEARSARPGDQIVPGPRTTGTRVLAIAADPEDVSPCLAQNETGKPPVAFRERAVVVIAAEVTAPPK
jgi:hypothetical protein